MPTLEVLERPLKFIMHLIARIGLWRGIALGIAGMALWDGAGYSVKGNSIARGPSLAFLRSDIPGGMTTHGYIMLALSVLIIYSCHDRPRMAYWVMIFTFMYSVSITCALIWGWHISGEMVWSAPSKWIFIAWVALWLAATTEHMVKRNEG